MEGGKQKIQRGKTKAIYGTAPPKIRNKCKKYTH
jgi:hypothetical protein